MLDTKTNSPLADKTVDCIGDLCPMPIYKASMALTGVADGQIVKIICTDPGSIQDFPAFAKQSGHALLRVDHDEQDRHLFFIQKRGA